MKKKLEAELISIAHRILKMKNKSDLVQLHLEAQKLYEKLSVLRFVDEHLADAKPTIGYTEVEDKLTEIFDSEPQAQIPTEESPETGSAAGETLETPAKEETISNIISGISEKTEKEEPEPAETKAPEASAEIEPIAETESPKEQVAEAEAEATEESEEEDKQEDEQPEETPEAEPAKIEEPAEEQKPAEIASENESEDLFKPAFEWGFEAKSEEAKPEEPKVTPAQISFDDLLGQDYKDPVFVKPEEVETPAVSQPSTSEDERRAAELAESNRRLADLRAGKKPETVSDVIPISRNFGDTSNVFSINKSENLNDRVSKGITIGLNDRIAFMKHLFNNSSEDYNRVLSQLITIDTLEEARSFIDTMVKPDYNNWEGKDEYEQRFMEIIEKKFA